MIIEDIQTTKRYAVELLYNGQRFEEGWKRFAPHGKYEGDKFASWRHYALTIGRVGTVASSGH